MSKDDFNKLWDYYLMLEDDLDHTSQFVEPKGQENTFSFEFAKLLILSCTEVESVLKMMCKEIDSSRNPKCMPVYREIIQSKFPNIEIAQVNVPRLGRSIQPLENWQSDSLPWWKAYQGVKHNRDANFGKATYIHACSALSALHILLLYLCQLEGLDVNDYQGKYIKNPYCHPFNVFGTIQPAELP